MGWLWASPPPSGGSDEPSKTSAVTTSDNANHTSAATAPSPPSPPPSQSARSGFALTEEQRIRIFGRPSPAPPSSNGTDSQSDAEVEAFLRSFESPAAAKELEAQISAEEKQPRQLPQPSKPSKPQSIDRVRPDGSLDISLDVMYPRTMSCWEAFDELWYCQSLGGKFNDVYRYGKIQPCTEQLNAWTFCMRTRLHADDHKQAQIRDFYANREAERKKKYGSSEDVWDVRETAVEKAFWRPHPDKLQQEDRSKR